MNDNKLDNKNHSVIKYRYQLKEYNINEIRQKYANKNKNENEDNNINVSQNIQEKKEEDKIDFTEIVDCFKQINDINDNIKQRMNNQIFKYLNCEDIYSFSIVNKSSGVCSYYYLLNIFLNKIDYYNTKYSSLKTRYEELLSSFTKVEVKSNLILSNNSKSGLRILNSPHYINMFNNPIEYFTKNKNGLFIYKILFQFSTNKIPIEDDNLFISKMLEEIKAKTAIKKSIRDFIYNLIDKNLDFSFDNINKCKELMKQYNIENMEINNMGEMDRPTTIIGYVVKDIMEFNGLIKAEDKKAKGFGVFVKKDKKDEDDSKNNGLKNKILSVCELIEKEILKCENSCKKIEEIISKYY